jgi:hypothetical protein
MSAFPESGRSDARKWEESKGRFRPEADIHCYILHNMSLSTRTKLAAFAIIPYCAPAFADVAREGYYIGLAFILVVLFLPVFIVALSRRTRKRLYLAALILWALTAFAYLWLTGARQNEFYLISLLPYILLVVYFFKEKKFVRAKE